ncbi:MAG TPA: hypothetical protein VMN82_00860 [Thermoanaerobaculia bacterium]|nr:hypothetical protein [Thermoanaerobaculia bacterium]
MTLEPCKAPTYASSAASPECGCARTTEAVPIRFESRVPAFEEMHRVPPSDGADPRAFVLALVGVAAFAFVRQRRGARLALLHLARPETVRERRTLRRPRLELSNRERRALAAVRALFERGPATAAVPVPAAAVARRER